MENKKSRTGHYNALIWLLVTGYEKEIGYTPSKYILDTLGPKVKSASSSLDLAILDTTLYDFTITSGVGDFLAMFCDETTKFENALLILNYYDEKYIVRDYYLANLAKQYTCWDTAYINCSVPEKIHTKVFDYILTPDQLPDGLTKIIS